MRSIDEYLLDDHLGELRDRLATAGVAVVPQTAVEVHRHLFDWRIRARAHVSVLREVGCVGRITLHLPHAVFAVLCPRAPAYLAGLLLHEVAHLEQEACRMLLANRAEAVHSTPWRRALEAVVNASGWVDGVVAVPRTAPPGEVDDWLAGLPWTVEALGHTRWILEDSWRAHG